MVKATVKKQERSDLTLRQEKVFKRLQKTNHYSLIHSLYAEPRRQTTDAIAIPTLLDDAVRDHATDIQAAFQSFDTRIISKDDWFQLFVTRFPDFATKKVSNEQLQRFSFAVYELFLCGLVTRGRYRVDSFEKSAMVWASY